MVSPSQAVHAAASEADYLDHRPDATWDVTQPRGRTYDVDFMTEEGTWMSVDTSPDGRWLVFDLLGHIYRVPAQGGKAECLTQDSGSALNYHPRYSPDGRSIAFVSDRAGQANLWMMDADGQRPRAVFIDPVSRISGPAWMPDGSAIVAVREFPSYSMHRRSARLWRFPLSHASEQPEELVGSPSGSQAYWPSPAADGKSVYFMWSGFAEPLHGLQRNQHLRQVDLRTRKVRLVTQPTSEREYRPGTNNELAPEASPDGKWLAYAKRIPGGSTTYRSHRLNERNALWIRDLHSGEERVLIDPITLDMQGAHGMKNLRILPGYSWAKDSQSLVMWHGGGLRRVRLDGTIVPIPFEARVHRVVSEKARAVGGIEDRAFRSRYLRWPSISESTSKVVFEAVGEIWSADLRGSTANATRLARWSPEAAYFMPEVSPDERQVVFVSWNDRTLGGVVVCDLADCRPAVISDRPGVYLYPVWDQAGTGIFVFRSRQTDSVRIANDDVIDFDLIRLSQGGVEVIQENVPPGVLSRGPDGRLYRLERRNDVPTQQYLTQGKAIPLPERVLTSLSPGDGTSRQHASFPAATTAMPSPDGRRVAFIEENELHVAPVYRATAAYAADVAHHWSGESLPQQIIKENPLHGVRTVSFGGAHQPRWIDEHRIVYAAGNAIHIHDVESGTSRRIDVVAEVQKRVPGTDRVLALTNARVLTMADAGIVDRGTIIVRGSRIACVGSCSTAKAEKVVDVGGRTVLPGFVDVHAHGGFSNDAIIPARLSPQALYLSHGVTTTLDPSVDSGRFFPVAELIDAGRIVGPRSYATGEALLPTSPKTGPADGRAAEGMIRRLASFGARSIKVFLAPRRDQRQMLGDWARRLGLSVTNEGADLYYNVGSIIDGHTGFEHPMHYIGLYRDAVEFFGRTKAVYSPTLIVAGAGRWAEEYHKSRADLWENDRLRRFMPWQDLALHRAGGPRPISDYGHPLLAEGVKDIRHHGGYAAIGGHGELWGLDSHWEMWTYAAAAPPIEVLAMATRDGAWMLGLEKEIGSIEVGKVADLVVLGADPLADIRNTTTVIEVMKAGVLYDAATLDQQWPTQQPYGVPPWLDDQVYAPTRQVQ